MIEAKDLAKSYDGRPVLDGFSLRVHRGDRVGIVGPNGAGKTTLIKILIGELAPDAGTVRLGAGLETVSLDQRRDSLDPDITLTEALTGGRGDQVVVGGQLRHVAGYLKDFLFAPEQLRTPLRVLSGGERARVMLARALARPSNLLVLDEPTNDLDLETLDVLEEMLGEYAGTILLISHDRDFLDRVATSVIVPEAKGRWLEYAGGYTDMLAQRGADLVREAPAKLAAKPAAALAPVASSTSEGRRRLSFHQQHALRTLPGRIETLSAEIGRLQAALADPTFFARDRSRFEAASAAIGRKGQELEAAETEWLELEILREELGA